MTSPPSAATRFVARWRAFAQIGLAMMFHDKAKLVGGLFGVVFATFLAGQQAGTFMGLVGKNTMVAKNMGGEVWVTPPGTRIIQGGKTLPERMLYRARAADGVAWASPMLYGTGSISLPTGGGEPTTLVGTDPAYPAGRPWNVVAGAPDDLRSPDAIFLEDSFRERMGGLNLGSIREIGGTRVQVVGFHWGLIPFGPPLAFAAYEKVREIMKLADRSQSYILVGVAPGHTPDEVAARLQTLFGGDAKVWTRDGLTRSTIVYLLTQTPIGVTFGLSTIFGLIVGFVIVAISMFGAVVDNIREFGTLKAIGATTSDLARVLAVQSVVYGLIGAGIGLTMVGAVFRGIRSANLAQQLPVPVIAAIPALMVLICLAASSLALLRLRKIEPGIVFRG